jgi:cytochrome c oxidase cbb3-type subunit I/II
MSDLEKKLEEELEKLEKAIEKEIKVIEKRAHSHNLFPIAAGGLGVFLLMVSMVVVAPYMFLLDVPPSDRAHEYTPLQQEGRSLFMSYGCFYCHSQQVRPTDWGIGNVSQNGDYYYDSPHALGTERTGPDLAQIGGARPTIWHQLHDKDPRSVSPGSIMPNFGFLTDHEIEALTAYIQALGSEYLGVDTSVTGGSAFHPDVPEQYVNASNLFAPMMMQVAMSYDPESGTYTGDPTLGDQWAAIFETGKANFTQRCLACHGCSGNAEGPYARHVVTQPANLHERISTFPGDYYHIWRVTGGVPGTAMPAWGLSLNDTQISLVAIYEMSFVLGSVRTVSGDISDAEGDDFANNVLNAPPINGTRQDFEHGNSIFTLFCAQCHGTDGQGTGPASNKTAGGYITPVPANFTESGGDFPNYGRWVWKVREGVETTNMPPWKWVLSDEEIYQVVFYEQSFSTPEDYNAKWAPLYSDSFGRNLKGQPAASNVAPYAAPAATATIVLAGMVLWNLHHRSLMILLQRSKMRRSTHTLIQFRRKTCWI